LLVSPEGHLTPLLQIQEAEEIPFDEPPCCFVKTQFGSLQGHIAIVHLLDALQQRFFSNLQVSDEGGYYENRDVGYLAQKMQILRSAIQSMSEGVKHYGLSPEASEDPSILAKRIERIAALVQQSIFGEKQGISESKEDRQQDDDPDETYREPSLEEEVEAMDRLRRKNDLRSERMHRRITESYASGMSIEDAFAQAMREEGFSIPERDSDDPDTPVAFETDSEDWGETDSADSLEDDDESFVDQERGIPGTDHPAVEQVKQFLDQVMNLDPEDYGESTYFSVLTRGGLEMLGGIVQATCDEGDIEDGDGEDHLARAWAISQLKRALSGLAYARGAVFGLRSEEIISDSLARELFEQLESILATIQELSAKAWGSET
jgi:hypothetical protein